MPIILSEAIPPMVGSSVEAGNVKSKVYNPLSGIELIKVLVYKTDQWINNLTVDEKERLSLFASTPSRIINYIEDNLLAHPDLTDTIGYPKSDIHWKLQLEIYTQYTEVRYWLMIKLYPQEEGRTATSKILTKLFNHHENGETVEFKAEESPLQLVFDDHFNCDEIPPDAIRILTNQPVLVQKKVANSTGADESPNSVLDVPTKASPQMKQAVEKAFHWQSVDDGKPTVEGIVEGIVEGTSESINIEVQPKSIEPGAFQDVEHPKSLTIAKPLVTTSKPVVPKFTGRK